MLSSFRQPSWGYCCRVRIVGFGAAGRRVRKDVLLLVLCLTLAACSDSSGWREPPDTSPSVTGQDAVRFAPTTTQEDFAGVGGYHVYTTPKKGAKTYWHLDEIPLHLGASGTPDVPFPAVQEALLAALNVWNDAVCFQDHVISYEGTTSKEMRFFSEEGDENVLFFVTEEWPHADTVVAMSTLTFRSQTGEIVAADLEINNVDYHFSVGGSSDGLDLQSVLENGIGHFLGIMEVDNPKSPMDKSVAEGAVNHALTDNDQACICCLYGDDMPIVISDGDCL